MVYSLQFMIFYIEYYIQNINFYIPEYSKDKIIVDYLEVYHQK
jgi:hypothetical protein